MPPRIAFGVNLNFAKYVYGPKRALELVRHRLGLAHAEMVSDNDFGAVLYLCAPEAFREYHYEIADHARAQGVHIPGVFTVYRETGAVASSNREIRESAYLVGLSLIEQAACYRARYFGAALFTMNKESAEDPESFQAQFDAALGMWKRWMGDARRVGLPMLLLEVAAAYREGCSTVDDARAALELLSDFHRKNPDTTVPVGLCYDTGHGISPTENPDDANRDFRAWFEAFPGAVHDIHLKNTDPAFLETWHFDRQDGIIRLPDVVAAIRDTLKVPKVCLHLEVPGKRGREIGEERALEEHARSIELVQSALEEAGYRRDEDGVWSAV